MIKRVLLYILLFLTSLSPFTEATIRYVSKTGNSTPPYLTWETASDSIQKCINVCEPYDTIYVANGEYKESLIINIELSLLGLSSDSTIICGENLADNTIDARANIKLENFYLIGKGDIPGAFVVFIHHGNNKTLIKNIRVENAIVGIHSRGGVITNSIFKDLHTCILTSSLMIVDTFFIENNFIYNNRDFGSGIENLGGGNHYIYHNILLGLDDNLSYGIYLLYDIDLKLKNNLVANYFFNLLRSESPNLDTAIITNNVFLQNKIPENFNVQIHPGNKTLFRNNILAYTGMFALIGYNNLEVDYNLFWQNTTNFYNSVIVGEHNVFSDPMFVKDTIPVIDGLYDFHLQKYSPAIDSGDPDIMDSDGSRSDIGMYGGELGTAYSYIDLPPLPPRNILSTVDTSLKKIGLSWGYNTEADFKNYIIYKDTVSGFQPSSENRYAETDTSIFQDNYISAPAEYFYKITAIDSNGNESQAVEEEQIIITGVNEIITETVREYSLYQNYPNPFNPETVIGYSVKDLSYVKIMIYEMTGELIKCIVNSEHQTGYYETKFNAEELGLSSGIYLYRIEIIGKGNIPKYADIKKMILLK